MIQKYHPQSSVKGKGYSNMTASPQENQEQAIENKSNDKELNFRRQQQMYERILAEKEAKLKEEERKKNNQLL